MGLSWYEPRRGTGSGGMVFPRMQHRLGVILASLAGQTCKRAGLPASSVLVATRPGFETWLYYFHAG